MALSPYSLISVDELKQGIGGGVSTETRFDEVLAKVCEDVTDVIERFCGRQFVTRGSATGYFSPQANTSILYTREWPLTTVTSVHESSSRTYDATTLLVADTDYLVVKPADRMGAIRRISGANGGSSSWLSGLHSVKVVYTAGYANTAAVPGALKAVARQLGVLTWRDWQKGNPGVSQESSGLGTATYSPFSAAFLTDKMKAALWAGFKRPPMDFDYEERIA